MTLASEQRMSNGTTTTADPAYEEAKQHFERLLDQPMVTRKPSEVLSASLGIPQDILVKAVKNLMPPESSESDFLAFMHIAAKFGLNPFIKEIYPFFSKKTGKMHTIVGIDGWASIVLRDKRFDGVEFEYVPDDDGNPEMIWCQMHVKGLSHPVKVPERFRECVRDTDQWRTLPWRMLRHRAYIQAARLAFGVHGIDSEFDLQDLGASGSTIADIAPPKPRKANPFKAGAPTAPLATAAADPTGGDSHPQAAPTPPAQPAPAPPPTEPKRRGRAAPQQVTTPAAAIAEQPAPPSSDIDDDPRTNFERAEDFANELNPAELRSYLMKLPQPKRNAAMAMADVQSIMEKMCTDEQLRQVACNAKCAELDGR